MSSVQIDYPYIRASAICPVCRKPKEARLVTCWACYRSHDLKYGNPEVTRILDEAEAQLTGA